MPMKITPPMRELLIEHMDGRRVALLVQDTGRMITTRSCLLRGLLRYDQPGVRRSTVLTEIGRGALGTALGECADALVAAGFDLNTPAPDLPEKLAALRKWANSDGFILRARQAARE